MFLQKSKLNATRCVLALLCAAAAVSTSGCRHPSIRETYEYHHRYDRMTDEYDPPVSRVFLNPHADINTYGNIVIGRFGTGERWVEDTEKASRYASIFFRQVLAGEFLKTASFSYISLDPDYRSDSPTVVLEGKITVLDPGSGTGRFLSPYLFFLQPASAVDLQVEGRVRDLHSGVIVLEFADRRRFLGRTPWGPTLKTFNDDWAIKQTCILTAHSLAGLLAYLRNRHGQ